MNRTVAAVALGVLSIMALPLTAQRRARLGPVVTSISVEDGNGTAASYVGFGGTIAFLTGDDGEAGIVIARYDDLSNNACVRQLTFFGFNSLYYPVGAKGVAPFASTEIGLARVTESSAPLLATCTGPIPPTVETTSELGFAFGLGVRVSATDQVAALVEGRFVQIPNSFIQGLEARANVSVAFGKPRNTQLLNGTLGPAVSFLIPISGPLRARTPFLGVRFRRDTKRSGVLGLQIDYAPLKASGCSGTGCEPNAILFAPGYEASLYPGWGRFYGSIGGLLVGFPGEGPDRGMTQGAHGGLGADIFAGERLMVNVNARLLWMQRNTGENIFGVQVGGSLSPKLERTH